MECDGVWYELQVEEPFVLLTERADSLRVDPEGSPDLLAPLLNLLRKPVLRAEAFGDGRLNIVLAENYEMRIPSGHKYESWMLVGSNGLRIVSMPDAQLAIWQPTSEPRSADSNDPPA